MQRGVKISLQEFAEEKGVSSKITAATVTQRRRWQQFAHLLSDFGKIWYTKSPCHATGQLRVS